MAFSGSETSPGLPLILYLLIIDDDTETWLIGCRALRCIGSVQRGQRRQCQGGEDWEVHHGATTPSGPEDVDLDRPAA